MKVQDIQPLVENILKEYFDDATQKKTHDYVDFKNPYSDAVQSLGKVDNFSKKHLSTLPINPDSIDARSLFAQKIFKPLKDKLPELFDNATFNDEKTDRVVITNYLKLKHLKVEISLTFTFPDVNTVNISYNYETYYDLNKLTPNQEEQLKSDENVVGVRTVGDYITFKYKPLERLNQVLKYSGQTNNLHKLFNWFALFMYSIQNTAQKIVKTDLP